VAVTATDRGGAAGHPPTIGTFVRLKLRLVGNGMYGNGRQAATFVLGCLFGAAYALIGFFAFIATGFASTGIAIGFAGAAGSGIVVGWLVLPTLFFGVDETLDPARFALLPVSRGRLMTGMGAAGLTGIPAVATMVVFVGAIIGAVGHGGALGGLIGLFGGALTMVFCVTGSRAITSALATALRSRRTRDIASVVLALVAASIGPLEIAATNLLGRASVTPLIHVLRVLGWTPLAAGMLAPYDANPLISLARLAVLAACIAVTAWWWSTSLEEAMIGTSTGGGRVRAARSGPGGTLLPWFLRGFAARNARSGPFLAIVARELRYWLRDPRRRAGLISMAAAGIVMPIVLRLTSRADAGAGPPVALTSALAGIVGGILLMQVFSFDGTAYAAHLLAAVRPRTEIAARVAGLALLVAPVLIVVTIGVCAVTSQMADVPIALGTGLGSFGCALGVASTLAVTAAFPMPESRNMFSMNTGSGTAKGLLAFVVMAVGTLVAVPIYIAAFVLPRSAELVIAVGWGVALAAAGVALGAARLRNSGPELLLAVTPRR
jgi:ABC-2 type transport system permease protein